MGKFTEASTAGSGTYPAGGFRGTSGVAFDVCFLDEDEVKHTDFGVPTPYVIT
jgi:hypothetical protein